MAYPDSFIMMVMGGAFVGTGIGVLFLERKKRKSYYDGLVTRTDLREFFERSPEHPEHSSMKIGGWITVIIGIVMLGLGGGLRLWG